MNLWERWTSGEKAVLLLFAAGLVAVVVATAVRNIPRATPEIHFHEAPAQELRATPAPPPPAPTDAPQVPIRVNVNTAGAAELETLPGIGPVTAQAIIEYRQRNGPFVEAAQLLEVKGIGPKKLEAIMPHITLRGSRR